MLESYSLRQTLRRFPIIGGGQSGTLTFFWNQLLTGQHLANSGEGQLKKNTLYFSFTRLTLPSCTSRRWHRLRLAQKKQGSRDSQSELTRESYSIYGPIVKTPNYSGCTNLFLGTMWTSPCTCPPASSGPARRTQQLDIQGGGQIMNKIFSAHFLSAQEIFFPLHINCQIIRWLSGFTNTSRTHFGKTSNILRPGNIFFRARTERWTLNSEKYIEIIDHNITLSLGLWLHAGGVPLNTWVQLRARPFHRTDCSSISLP